MTYQEIWKSLKFSEKYSNSDSDSNENLLSNKTLNVLENLIIAAETGTISLSKKQIIDTVHKKEGYETDSDEENVQPPVR